MTRVLGGQLVNNSAQMGLVSIPENINHHKGSTATKFDKPEGAQYLIIHVEVENFRMQLGDTVSTIGAYATPSVAVTNGSGTLALETGEVYVYTAPDTFTVTGQSGASIMTYAWV